MYTIQQMEAINRETTALTKTTRFSKKLELKGTSAIKHASPRLGGRIDTVKQGISENEGQSKDDPLN